MDKFRSRSSHDDQEPRSRPQRAFGAPGADRTAPPRRSPARIVVRLLLLAALATSSLTLTHCRMVGDRLTGISVDQLKRKDDCVKACRNANKDAIKAEKDRHKVLVIACAGNQACIDAENARYQAALQAIEAAYRDCLYQCHLQGGGSAGD